MLEWTEREPSRVLGGVRRAPIGGPEIERSVEEPICEEN